ncbi:sigma-70 family RNA polymerase sigma factor [Candidatus Woesearchaeota archaeon]|nr:sigma-70 family RNA polymerase sigma factor [Candidatus Woesearchaeota archaeon]
MTQKEWSKKSLVNALIDLHYSGIRLRAEDIQDSDPSITNALYYKNPEGKRLYFDSLSDARVAVSNELNIRGDEEAAKKVLEYNKPCVSHNKYSDEQRQKIIDETLKEFKEKIDAGQDLRLRALRESDRAFCNRLERYVGYSNAFEHFELDKNDYSRLVKYDKSHYLDKLEEHLIAKNPLDRTSLEKIDPHLVSNINSRFDGYYDGLAYLQERLARGGRHNLSKKCSPSFWKAEGKRKRKQESLDYIKSQKEKIKEISEEDAEELKKKGWLSSNEIASLLDVTPINASRNIVIKFPEKVVKVIEGKRHRYLFHESIQNDYERKVEQKSLDNSLHMVSNELGVGYSKIRSICEFLELGTFEDRSRILDDSDKEKIKSVLEREKRIHDQIIRSLEPSKNYTFTELSFLGIPISYFDRKIRSGELKSVSDDIRMVSGKTALDYFKSDYNLSHLSQRMRLLSFFHPNLNTISDLVPLLQIERTTLRYRLSILKEENPDCCFRLRKSSNHSRVVSTNEIIPFLNNWEIRDELKLIRMTEKISEGRNYSICEFGKLIKNSYLVRNKGFRVDRSNQQEAFVFLNTLDDFLKENVEIDGVDLLKKDLYLLYKYMDLMNYKTAEIEEVYTLQQFADRIDDQMFFDKVKKERENLMFALYHSNYPMVRKIVNGVVQEKRELGIDSYEEDYLLYCEEVLMDCVNKFNANNEWGASFGRYAWSAIERKIQIQSRKLNRIQKTSLDKKVQDSAKSSELGDLIPDEKSKEIGLETEIPDLKERIGNLLNTLDDREKEVLICRFFKKEKLREVSEKIGLTRERVRQIQNAALGKLSKLEDAKILQEYL